MFGDFFHIIPWWLLLPYAALCLWMLADTYRRGVEHFWLWIILIFHPIGTLAYFFVVKLPTLRLTRGFSSGPLWQRKLSLDELRYRVERTPTVMNRIALAERLMEKGGHADAIPHLEAALALDETYCQAMHDLAVCHLECKQPEQALPVLDKLMKRDNRWADYRGWKTLMSVHEALGRHDEVLKTCRELEKRMPVWENKCRLAELLIDQGHKGEAAQLLIQALEDHHFAPLKIRLRNWRWARHAQRLLAEAECQ
jgi:hypothetical protein